MAADVYKKNITAGKKHEPHQLFKNIGSPNAMSISNKSVVKQREKSACIRDNSKVSQMSSTVIGSSSMNNFSSTASIVASKNHYGSSTNLQAPLN